MIEQLAEMADVHVALYNRASAGTCVCDVCCDLLADPRLASYRRPRRKEEA
jgi:hypothetical protein